MEGVQICGISNSSSPPSHSEDNKHPLKFGESVVNINVLNIRNLRKVTGAGHSVIFVYFVLSALHMNLKNLKLLSYVI
jgi:hypothetical protein